MIPLELLTGGVATAGSFVFKAIGTWMENKAEERKMLLQLRGMDIDEHKALLNAPRGVALTRRLIALSIVFAVLILPKVAWLLSGSPIPVNFPFENTDSVSTLWGLFTSSESTNGFINVAGIPIFPWEGHAMMAVVGFYFGDRLAGKR